MSDGAVYIVMGAPRAGKETVSKWFAELIGAVHISSGDELRKRMRPEDVAIMNSGGLVPESVFEEILVAAIADVPRGQAIVLDGVSKKAKEAPWLVAHLASAGRRIEAVIYLEIDFETQLARTNGRGRGDDDPAVQEERWRRFVEETLQSVVYYGSLGLLLTIDGRQDHEKIRAEIMERLAERIEAL